MAERVQGHRCIRCKVLLACGGNQGAESAIRYNAGAERGGSDRGKRTGQDRECRVDHLDDHDKKSTHAFWRLFRSSSLLITLISVFKFLRRALIIWKWDTWRSMNEISKKRLINFERRIFKYFLYRTKNFILFTSYRDSMCIHLVNYESIKNFRLF